MTSPPPQVSVTGVRECLDTIKLWICGSNRTCSILEHIPIRRDYLQRAKYRYNESLSAPHIFELKFRNRDLNSLLCEIFTYLVAKIQKPQTQSIFYGRQNFFDHIMSQAYIAPHNKILPFKTQITIRLNIYDFITLQL